MVLNKEPAMERNKGPAMERNKGPAMERNKEPDLITSYIILQTHFIIQLQSNFPQSKAQKKLFLLENLEARSLTVYHHFKGSSKGELLKALNLFIEHLNKIFQLKNSISFVIIFLIH